LFSDGGYITIYAKAFLNTLAVNSATKFHLYS